MAIFNKKSDSERQNANYATKADVILQRQAELAEKIDKLLATGGADGSVGEKVARETAYISKQNSSILEKLLEENAQIKKEINYVAAQCENVFIKLSGMMTSLEEKIMKYAVIGKPAEAAAAEPQPELYDEVAPAVEVEQPAVDGKYIDYDKLAERLAEKFAEKELISALDYEDIAKRVAEYIPQEVISPDYIASKVAEQIIIPPAVISGGDTPLEVTSANIDADALSDEIARKVSALSPNDFDIIVDDEGCRSLAEAVAESLDYDGIVKKLAEHSAAAEVAAADADEEYVNTEELAQLVSEKLAASGVNEDAIADKTAAALSNYMPEVDGDEIADKVAAAVLASIPSTEIDYDAIASGVAEKLAAEEESTEESEDFDIVIDDDGLGRITDSISEKIAGSYAAIEEMDADIGRRLDEIKAMLAGGAIVAAAASADGEQKAEEQPADEPLVTVSDIVDEEEVSSEPEDEVMENIFDDVDEKMADGEAEPDGMDEMGSGVDFANMMKYNRSFIARIIQSSDDVKRYYGEIKNAMLAYRKVNSSVAWGAERFNKGRETIAKLKIRGKTLCLYLNLDPNEYKTSVYHHVDVSDNKSMHGTPMMVKIKSPLGVRKAIRLIDDMLAKRNGERRPVQERDYAAMYPYETIEELIEDGLVKDVSKNK